jgi:hypothetical protein
MVRSSGSSADNLLLCMQSGPSVLTSIVKVRLESRADVHTRIGESPAIVTRGYCAEPYRIDGRLKHFCSEMETLKKYQRLSIHDFAKVLESPGHAVHGLLPAVSE